LENLDGYLHFVRYFRVAAPKAFGVRQAGRLPLQFGGISKMRPARMEQIIRD
jgi:hypothetical protein